MRSTHTLILSKPPGRMRIPCRWVLLISGSLERRTRSTCVFTERATAQLTPEQITLICMWSTSLNMACWGAVRASTCVGWSKTIQVFLPNQNGFKNSPWDNVMWVFPWYFDTIVYWTMLTNPFNLYIVNFRLFYFIFIIIIL